MFRNIFRVLNSEEGHVMPLLGALPASVGAVLLAIGAAADSGALAIVGGIVLAVAVSATTLLQHVGVEYPIYSRLDKLEGGQ